MPPPEEVAELVDRGERIVVSSGWGLGRLDRESRRRMLAWAVFAYLRHDGQGAYAPEPVPVSPR